jgi:hypothetical protein
MTARNFENKWVRRNAILDFRVFAIRSLLIRITAVLSLLPSTIALSSVFAALDGLLISANQKPEVLHRYLLGISLGDCN